MKESHQEIQTYILKLLEELSHDWDYSKPLTPETKLVTELAFESLDLVVLGTALQEHYKLQMPFAEFLAEIGQRPQRDLSVAELVSFVDRHLNAPVAAVVLRSS